MEPLAAGIGAVGSLIGSFMNTSSQQAANAANLQFATEKAQGQFMPAYAQNLVAAGNASGISPLVLAGVNPSTPSPAQVGTSPGEGLSQAARYVSQIKDPHTVAMEALAERLGQSNIERTQAETSQTKIDTARSYAILKMLGEAEGTLNTIKGGVDRTGQFLSRFSLPNMWSELHSEIGDLFGSSPQSRITIPATPGNFR